MTDQSKDGKIFLTILAIGITIMFGLLAVLDFLHRWFA